MRVITWAILLICAGFLLLNCSPSATYERRLKRELASGIRHDSLFLGISLGMTSKEFYSHCWKLNRDSLVRQGTANTTVEYQLREELKAPATVNFYPDFEADRIVEMPVHFIYNGWAPWNQSLSSDSLQLDILQWYKRIYGRDFLEVEHPERGKAFVQIRGNRRITIFKVDEKIVLALFKDMSQIPEEPDEDPL
jgi:hypothetical protein